MDFKNDDTSSLGGAVNAGRAKVVKFVKVLTEENARRPLLPDIRIIYFTGKLILYRSIQPEWLPILIVREATGLAKGRMVSLIHTFFQKLLLYYNLSALQMTLSPSPPAPSSSSPSPSPTTTATTIVLRPIWSHVHSIPIIIKQLIPR